MSNIVWSAEQGWHDGPEATITIDGARFAAVPITPVSLAKTTKPRGVWVVTTSIAGYLPESDPLLYASWEDAAAGIADHMRDYADRDDDMAAETMPEDAFEDDQPAMLATVASILRDDPPAAVGQAWGAWVEDGSGRRIVFELSWVRDVTDVCIAHDDSHGCCDYCGLWVEQD